MNTPPALPLGQMLRQRRLAAGLSQAALAQQSGLSVDAIAALERGRRTTPRADTLALLATALALTPTERAAFAAAASTSPPIDAADWSTPPDALIGREQDVAAAASLVRARGARLLTFTGPGGVGKTRLAFAVAEHLKPDVRDRVVVVDLSALRDPALVPAAMARALGVREVGARPMRELLLAELRDQSLLLLLDNCEQVLAAAPVIAELTNACPRLLVLTTSRAPLRVRGEQLYPVGPLAVPAEEAPGALAANPAVRLFVARAQTAARGFTLSAEHAAAVAAICRRLDGLPLAIELAAARCALLPPAALLGRLERRLSVLTQGARDLPDRQRTLRATLDWSYDLLSAPEQGLFRRLAVFSGGSTPDLIEAVSEPASEPAVLDGLAALVDHSLLRQVGVGEEPRYAMLETIREYAAEQLERSGEAAALRQVHAEQFVALAERAAADLDGAGQAAALALLEQEHDNIRAALAWSLADGPGTEERSLRGLRLGAALWRFWQVHGHFGEGRGWLERLLARTAALTGPEAAALRAAVLAGAGRLAHSQSDFARAAALLEESLALYRALGRDVSLAEVLINRGLVAHARGDYAEAATLLGESLGLYRARGDQAGTGNALFRLALITRERGDHARATQLYEECLGVYRARGDRAGEAVALLGLGDIARDQGEPALAAAYCQESLALYRALGERWGMACSLNNLGVAAYERGNFAEATARCEESLALFREIKIESSVAEELVNLGRIAAAQGEDGRAAGLLAEGLRLARDGGPRWLVAAALEALAPLALADRAAELAARWLGAAEAMREVMGSPLWPADRARYEQTVAILQAALPAAAFAAAWQAGRTESVDATVATALGAAAGWAGSTPAGAEGCSRVD